MHTRFHTYIFKLVCIFTVIVTLSACDSLENTLKMDRGGHLEKQDYRDALAPRDIAEDDFFKTANRGGNIPALKPYVAGPSALSTTKPMPVVSVSVNRSVPLKDLLYDLAQKADLDLELDPRIQGSIIFTARKRPLDQIIDRIAKMASLRYSISDNTLRIELDSPFHKTYKIDYLSYIRSNQSAISTDVSVVSGDGADTGSTFSSSSESQSDFWGELERNLTAILANQSAQALKTAADPALTIIDQDPNFAAVGQPDEDGNLVVAPPSAIVNIAPQMVASTSDISQDSGDNSSSAALFSINKQAGLVNVFASGNTHDEVQDYLQKVRDSVTSQVLIEAKILEVTLNDEFASGINWSSINTFSPEASLAFTSPTLQNATIFDAIPIGASEGGQTPSSAFAAVYNGNDFNALITAISEYGTTKALASPRLIVLNNQSAVLNVAKNRVFFDIQLTREDGIDGEPDTVEVESEIRNVPEGILINVIPSISKEDKTVSLAVRPTVTSVGNDTVIDPGVQIVAAQLGVTGIESRVPQVSFQEVDTVMNVRSGQPIVMGGLIQDKTSSIEDGVPVLADIPVMGSLFLTHYDQVRKTELVIFIKATILQDPSDSIHNTDRDLYRRFSVDRRPFRL